MPTTLRHAWRSLWRTPVFTITAAFTLVIGIGASVAMFAIVDGVLLKPLPYGKPSQLVGVWHDLPGVNLPKATQTLGTYFTYKGHARRVHSSHIDCRCGAVQHHPRAPHRTYASVARVA